MTTTIPALPIVQWNPFYGCTPVSPGCGNCPNPPIYSGFTGAKADEALLTNGGKTWSGAIRQNFAELIKPLAVQPSSDVAVCPLGDLFHEDAPDSWIDDVFAVIARCPRHVFRIMTKRVERMQKYCAARFGDRPPQNVAFCAVAERQVEADLRIPHLMKMKGYWRFAMFFPLMSRIDVFEIPGVTRAELAELGHAQFGDAGSPKWIEKLARDFASIGVMFADGLFRMSPEQYANTKKHPISRS